MKKAWAEAKLVQLNLLYNLQNQKKYDVLMSICCLEIQKIFRATYIEAWSAETKSESRLENSFFFFWSGNIILFDKIF